RSSRRCDPPPTMTQSSRRCSSGWWRIDWSPSTERRRSTRCWRTCRTRRSSPGGRRSESGSKGGAWTSSSDGGASDDLLAIIEASRAQIGTTARRRRAAIVGLIATVVVLVGMLWLTVSQRRSAQEARRLESMSQAETRRLLAMTYMEQGRALLIDDRPARPMRALPYLLAAQTAGIDSPVLRALFGQASRSLPLVTFVGHTAAVNIAAYSPDGARMVTASDDHSARIWDAATGTTLAVLD